MGDELSRVRKTPCVDARTNSGDFVFYAPSFLVGKTQESQGIITKLQGIMTINTRDK